MSDKFEVCIGCDHSLARHFVDVTGVVRCLVSASGVSDRGVLGIPWRRDCDCADYTSKQADAARAHEAREKAKDDAATAMIVASIRAAMSADLSSDRAPEARGEHEPTSEGET